MKHLTTVVLAVVLLTVACIHEQPVTLSAQEKVQEMFKEVAPHIIKCFHRTGTFKDVKVESYQPDGRGLRVIGEIYWRGIVSDRTLKVELRVDERENCLVHIINDDAVLERDEQCPYTSWTPMANYDAAAADSQVRLSVKVKKIVKEFLDAIEKDKKQ